MIEWVFKKKVRIWPSPTKLNAEFSSFWGELKNLPIGILFLLDKMSITPYNRQKAQVIMRQKMHLFCITVHVYHCIVQMSWDFGCHARKDTWAWGNGIDCPGYITFHPENLVAFYQFIQIIQCREMDLSLRLLLQPVIGHVGFMGNGDLWGFIFFHTSEWGFMGIKYPHSIHKSP